MENKEAEKRTCSRFAIPGATVSYEFKDFTEEFSLLKGVEKVTTPLVEHVPQSEQEVEEFKEEILGSQSGQSLVAKNWKAALILITLEPDLFGNEEADRLTEEVLKITQEKEGPEKIYVVGDAYLSNYA